MNMDEVAARTGMSKATVYQLFDSKQELALGVARRNLRKGLSLLNGAGSLGLPWEQLEEGLKAALISRIPLGDAQLGIPPALIRADPTCGELREQLRSSVVAIVEAAKRAGEYASDLDGEVVFAICQGLAQADFQTAGRPPEEVVKAGVATVFRGFRAPTRKKDRKKK
jgi:AcrR family transcriptional regulator